MVKIQPCNHKLVVSLDAYTESSQEWAVLQSGMHERGSRGGVGGRFLALTAKLFTADRFRKKRNRCQLCIHQRSDQDSVNISI